MPFTKKLTVLNNPAVNPEIFQALRHNFELTKLLARNVRGGGEILYDTAEIITKLPEMPKRIKAFLKHRKT